MMSNPLLEAFRNEGHGWAASLLALLDDFERRLQELGSDPPETQPGNGGSEDGEDQSGTESASGSVQE